MRPAAFIASVRIADGAELNRLLDTLLQYGNYKVSLSIEALKR